MKPKPKVWVLCTVDTVIDALSCVLQAGYSIDKLIGLSPDYPHLSNVSGYMDIADYAKQQGLDFDYASTYVLSEEKDGHVFDDDIDVLWVLGWQRLVPTWLLGKIKVASIGVHGSPDGIMQGRGRSPQNWALILGCPSFQLALFLLTPGIDDGNLLLTSRFDYDEGDTIVTSYKKAALCCGQMMKAFLSNPESVISQAVPQKGDSYYFPQRTAAEAGIDWSQSCRSIVNACRAQTKPYPGAYTMENATKISVWSCQIFDNKIGATIGEIVHVFWDEQFLVQAADGRVLVREWDANEGQWKPLTQTTLESISHSNQMNTIISRHQAKYPELPLNTRILELADN